MLQKSSTVKTLEIFFLRPTEEHYLMDISKNIRLAHTSVRKQLDILVGAGLITQTVKKRGKRKYPTYKANTDNPNFKKYKIVYNLNALFESGLIEFIEKKITPNSIVVFGSYRRGEDVEESDIDLFVEANKEMVDVSTFEKKLKRKIEIHFNRNFSNYPKELKNNIINGIVIHGFLEGYK